MTDTVNTENKASNKLVDAMPDWGAFVTELYREDVELAMQSLREEFELFEQTGEDRYLLKTLERMIKARGVQNITRESGMSRQTIYNLLDGKMSPRMDTMTKLLRTLGLRFYLAPIKPAKPKRVREKKYV
ncbi:hypothetical protein LJC31_06065 [Synergistaceae bacterium OttesenSCG-928-I11]|nr:hypothetical protein [Synergistaceae bacterium OttesenSCG-928-I11]